MVGPKQGFGATVPGPNTPAGTATPDVRRVAERYSDFPQFDRGLPYRLTGRVTATELDAFRTHAAGVVEHLGFDVVQNNPPKAVAGPFYRGPSGPQGLIIGERGLTFDVRRRSQGNLMIAVLASLGILLIVVAVVLGNYSDSRFLFLVVGGGFSLLGVVFLGQRRWSFDSELLYVYYSVSSSGTHPPNVGSGEERDVVGSSLHLDVTITAGKAITQNVSTKIGTSRQYIATLDGSPTLTAAPAQVFRMLQGSSTL